MAAKYIFVPLLRTVNISSLYEAFALRVAYKNPTFPSRNHNRTYVFNTEEKLQNHQAMLQPKQTPFYVSLLFFVIDFQLHRCCCCTARFSTAFIPVSVHPSLLFISSSISPHCDSHIIVMLTRGSTRQPEDLLLEIEPETK